MKDQKEIVNFALLDDEGILIGYESAERGTTSHSRIEVPDLCDLLPFKYRWNMDERRFDPLRTFDEVPEDEPHTLKAIWLGFVSLAATGHKFPEDTEKWMVKFGQSIDGDLGRNPDFLSMMNSILDKE